MSNGFSPALRFAHTWHRGRGRIQQTSVTIPIPGNGAAEGTLFSPAGDKIIADTGRENPAIAEGGPPGPAEQRVRRGWVVLHGMTALGRNHPELIRFVHALAGTGAHVLVPEIKEWMDLRFAPTRAQEVIRGAVDWLYAHPASAPGGVMVVGFSFGAPQALQAAATPEVGDKLRGVVGWGGYGHLERTLWFCFTGEHRWQEDTFCARPDPYARWVIGANCLPLVPEYDGHRDVAAALRRLAAEAGQRQVEADDPSYAGFREELRSGLQRASLPVFDLFVPRQDEVPDRESSRALVRAVVRSLGDAHDLPEQRLVDPFSELGHNRIRVPVLLFHGGADRLIPFTETLHVQEALGPFADDLSAQILGRFGHSASHGGPADGLQTLQVKVQEGFQFVNALAAMFRRG